MKETLIKNGLVVTASGTQQADILIQDGRIAAIGKDVGVKASKSAHSIDANGLHVMAGFVDMHCHLRDPGFTHKEDIFSGSRAALSGGFTTICCMPNTNPCLDNAALIKYVTAVAKEANAAKVYPIGTITKGQKGQELAELKTMHDRGAIAFSDDGVPVENGGLMKLALSYAETFGLLLICHAEDKSIAGDGVVNEGFNASKVGLKGISRVAEEAMTARDILLAESLNARVHIAHVSTKGSVALVRDAKKRGVRVTAETCPHYFSITDDAILTYNTNAKINPPLREKMDVDAIIEGIKDGTIDAIATDHAPHHADEKAKEFDLAPFGISGFETAFGLCYTHLVKTGHITLNQLTTLLSAAPARILGLEVGELKEGAVADLTLVDLKKVYTVDKESFVSKGKNTIFHGHTLTGAVIKTLVDGEEKLTL